MFTRFLPQVHIPHVNLNYFFVLHYTKITPIQQFGPGPISFHFQSLFDQLNISF